MLSAGFAVFAGTSDAASDKVIVRDDTVVINVEKTFDENKDQLAKLGITNYKYWAYDEEYKSYVLTLDNVHLETMANVGIAFECNASHSTEPEYHGVVIKLVGKNSIISGPEHVYQRADKGCCAAICAGTQDEGKSSLSIVFAGDGELIAKNVIPIDFRHDITCSCGIAVDGTVVVAGEATVIAGGSDITTYYDDATEFYCSIGVNAEAIVVTSALIAKGGDVDIIFDDNVTSDALVPIVSFGMVANKYTFADAYVHGVGGTATFAIAGEISSGVSLKVGSHSSGIAIEEHTAGATFNTLIANSKVVGESGTVTGTLCADSTGIELGSKENGNIVIKNSIIEGDAGNAMCVQPGGAKVDGYTESIGLFFKGSVEITGSLVQGASGELATGGKDFEIKSEICKVNFLTGILSCGDAMKVTDSIINVHGHGLADYHKNYSSGIIVEHLIEEEGTPTPVQGDLTVVDSEIYAVGSQYAIVADKTDSVISFGYRAIWNLSDPESPTAITDPSTIFDTTKNIKAVSVLYKYDVVIADSVVGVLNFQRCETPNVIVGAYHGFVPEGMVFAGYIDEDGNDVAVGSQMTLNENGPTPLFAIFEPAPEQDNGNPGIAWAIVIVALVIVAILVAALCVWKSRQ